MDMMWLELTIIIHAPTPDGSVPLTGLDLVFSFSAIKLLTRYRQPHTSSELLSPEWQGVKLIKKPLTKPFPARMWGESILQCLELSKKLS